MTGSDSEQLLDYGWDRLPVAGLFTRLAADAGGHFRKQRSR